MPLRKFTILAADATPTAPAETPPEPPTEDYGRLTPPNDIAAERAVLGSMMLSRDAIAEITEVLVNGGADFYRPAHTLVYDAALDLYARGEPVDQITVSDALTGQGTLTRAGGAAYIYQLVAAVATPGSGSHYAGIVHERAILRRLTEVGTKITQMGFSHDGGDVDDILNAAQAEVFAIGGTRAAEDTIVLGEILDGTLDEVEAAAAHGGTVTGLSTGFIDVDALLHGLHPGQSIVIAGRPGAGKSTFGLDIVRASAVKGGQTAVIFSLEMSRNEIGMRVISAEANIPLDRLRSGMLSDDDWRAIAGVHGRLSEAPLYVDDSPNMTMPAIRAKCRRLKQNHNLRLVVIDYLQLMSSGKRVESRQQEVSEFSRALKLLAKELEVPVIALSQLNRGSEQRADKKPQLSDLRESGSIEQDADVVILLHREDMYDADSARAGEADIIVAKHRNGPTRTIALAFQGRYSRFVDMASGF